MLLLCHFADKLRVVLDNLQHADVIVHGSTPELMSDREVLLAARRQVITQRGGVLVVELFACHPDVPRCRAVSTIASSLSLAWQCRICSAIARAGAPKSMSSR